MTPVDVGLVRRPASSRRPAERRRGMPGQDPGDRRVRDARRTGEHRRYGVSGHDDDAGSRRNHGRGGCGGPWPRGRPLSPSFAGQGHLLRLWRPPVQPGEWRTIGLFAASDEVELEAVLASMPLRVWRSDDVVALSSHPNDPGRSVAADATQFLTTFTVTIPDDADEAEVEDLTAREADRTRELAEQGHLIRLWMLPPDLGQLAGARPVASRGRGRAPGDPHVAADGQVDLPPSRPHSTEHPNDPARTAAWGARRAPREFAVTPQHRRKPCRASPSAPRTAPRSRSTTRTTAPGGRSC